MLLSREGAHCSLPRRACPQEPKGEADASLCAPAPPPDKSKVKPSEPGSQVCAVVTVCWLNRLDRNGGVEKMTDTVHDAELDSRSSLEGCSLRAELAGKLVDSQACPRALTWSLPGSDPVTPAGFIHPLSLLKFCVKCCFILLSF